MRKHPLLALFTATTTVAIATTGAIAQSAFASRANTTHRTEPRTARPGLRDLAVLDTPTSRLALPETRLSGAVAVSFAVTGGPVLGSYLTPAMRHRELAARHARREAHLAALRRRLASHHTYVPAGGVWARLRACESGGNYTENTGNGYYGAYQFLPSTWWSIGFTGMPNQAPPAVQDRAARLLESRSGWGAWPVCSQMIGL